MHLSPNMSTWNFFGSSRDRISFMAFDLAFFSLAQTPTIMRRPLPRVQWPGWRGVGMTIVGTVGAGGKVVGRAGVDVDAISGRAVVVLAVAVVAVALSAMSGVGEVNSPSATAASAGAPFSGGLAINWCWQCFMCLSYFAVCFVR